jgi:hypothetical protein
MGGDFGVRQSVRQYLKKSPFWSEALIVGCQFCQKLKSERSIKNELIWNSGSIENRMESGSGYCTRDDEGAF